MAGRRPLTARPLDLLYFTFFLIHVPATILCDIQALYPPSLVPKVLAKLPALYLLQSGDPIMAGAFGLNGAPWIWIWFKSFLVLEAVFQLPVFFIGLYGLWRDSRTIYPLLLIYSASSATTTIACLATLLSTPLAVNPALVSSLTAADATSPLTALTYAADALSPLSITSQQRLMLLGSYVPFLLVPLGMCFDMAIRVGGLMAKGIRAEETEKKAIKVE